MGSSPNIEFFRTVLGIDTDAPGFKKVRIEPHLGDLKNVNGKMPHPNGTILANYQFKGARPPARAGTDGDGPRLNGSVGQAVGRDKWDIEITLPEEISGTFIWKGKTYL